MTHFSCLIKLNQYTNILSLIASITSIVRKWNCWRRRGMWLRHDWGLSYKGSLLWSNYLQAQTRGNLCDWTVLLQLHSEFNCLLINSFFYNKKFQHSVPTRWIYLSRCIQWMWLARDVSRYERSVSTRCLQKKRKSVRRRCLSESNRLAFHQVFIATTIYMKLSLNPNRLLF